MAVFEELNRNANAKRLEDPERRTAERIVREEPSKKKRSGSTSVSISTYQRTKLFVNITVGLLIFGAAAGMVVFAVKAFIS